MVENNKSLKIDPSFYVPKIMFLTKGKGIHKDYLTALLHDSSFPNTFS